MTPGPDGELTTEELRSLMHDHLIEVRRLAGELVPGDDHTGCHMIQNLTAGIALRVGVHLPGIGASHGHPDRLPQADDEP